MANGFLIKDEIVSIFTVMLIGHIIYRIMILQKGNFYPKVF